jgi:hypothetical protein
MAVMRGMAQHGTWRGYDLTPVGLEAHHSCGRVLMMNDFVRRILLMTSSNIACMMAEELRDTTSLQSYVTLQLESFPACPRVAEYIYIYIYTYFCSLSE